MRIFRLLLLTGLTAVLGLVLVVPMSQARAESQSEEAQFIALINVLRVGKGLVPLLADGRLTDVARSWSAQMGGANVLSHNPNFAAQMGSGWRKLGENVGVGSSVPWLEQAFEASPHHYENLVDPDYRLIGVGIVDAADGTIWVTEDFEQAKTAVAVPTPVKPALNGKPAPAPAPKPAPAPRPAPAPKPAPSGSAAAAAAASKTAAHPSTPAAAPPVVPPPPVPQATVPTPVVEGTKTTRKPKTTHGTQVLAAAIGPSPHRMWSGYAIGCPSSLLLGLMLSRVAKSRTRTRRARV